MVSGEGFANTMPIYEGYFLPHYLVYTHGWVRTEILLHEDPEQGRIQLYHHG